jgi:hypothetical protein
MEEKKDNQRNFWAGSGWILSYYVGSMLFAWLGEKISPSGGHSPGLGGIYLMALFPLATLALVIGSIVSDFDRKPSGISGRTIVHFVAIAMFIIWLAT